MDVEGSKLANFRGAGRPSEHAVARLSHRVWAAMLRHAVKTADHELGAKKPLASWSELEYRLASLRFRDPLPVQREAKGLRGVAAHGADPRRLEWRIDAEEAVGAEIQGLCTVTRHVSGLRHGESRYEKRNYLRLPLDAVALGEKLVPGSSRWLDQVLWWLVAARNPSVDEVRNCIALSLSSLGLVRPTLDERRRCIGEAAYQAAFAAPRAEVLSRYRQALESVSQMVTPDVLALLIALAKESYLTNEDDLRHLHCEVLCELFGRWLDVPEIAPLKADLTRHILHPILISRPIRHYPPTDPHDLPMAKSEWVASVRSTSPFSGASIELPFLADLDTDDP